MAPAALACAALAGALAALAALPYAAHHIAPAMTPATLPPKLVHGGVFGLVAHVDALQQSLTPPNLYLFRQLMGYMHTVEIYSATKLGIADVLAASPGGAPVPLEDITHAVAPSCKDAAASSPASCGEVQKRVGRLLGALSAYGLFQEAAPSAWAHTPASSFLAASHPASLRNTALQFGGVQFRMMSSLPEAIVLGESSFKLVHGDEFWAWYTAHPDEHAIFDGTMNELGHLGGADAAIALDVPWGRLVDVVVDVGGGLGELVGQILREHRALSSGMVLDLEPVVQRAAAVWGIDAEKAGKPLPRPAAAASAEGASASGKQPSAAMVALAGDLKVRNRMRLVAGDMFDPSTLPSPLLDLQGKLLGSRAPITETGTGSPQAGMLERCGHSAGPRYGYVLRDILHDWTDDDSVRILRSLRGAMRGNTTRCFPADKSAPVDRSAPPGFAHLDRVFIVARLLQPGARFIPSLGAADADMVMLGAFGSTAGERTTEHFSRLLAQAGLQLASVTPTRGHYFVLEAIAV